MNKYPTWWSKTLTVYNKVTDSTTNKIVWYRHKLTGCFWKYVHDREIVGNTAIETNYTVCRIPVSDNFVEKYLYTSLPVEELENKFTLGIGDIIVLHDSDDIIDEYTPGSRSTDLLKKYKSMQGCIVIEHVSINVGDGRDNEHYLVNGV